MMITITEVKELLEYIRDALSMNREIKKPQVMAFYNNLNRYTPDVINDARDLLLSEWDQLRYPKIADFRKYITMVLSKRVAERQERRDASMRAEFSSERTDANIKRVGALVASVINANDKDERVKCCLCGEDTLKFVSINEYLRFYDPDDTRNIGEYACHAKGCTKKIINNAGYDV